MVISSSTFEPEPKLNNVMSGLSSGLENLYFDSALRCNWRLSRHSDHSDVIELCINTAWGPLLFTC